ncbi:hypothetical protein MPTK1_1g09740 [Marchantia polymorpha subsp. ruderalis]
MLSLGRVKTRHVRQVFWKQSRLAALNDSKSSDQIEVLH